MPHKKHIYYSCKGCGKDIENGLYCNRKCYHKNRIPENKGKSGLCSEETIFKMKYAKSLNNSNISLKQIESLKKGTKVLNRSG